MGTTRQAAARQRRRRRARRLLLGATSALAAASVLAYLLMAWLPGRGADADSAAATRVAPTQTEAPTPSGSGVPTAKATASRSTSGSPTPAATATPSRKSAPATGAATASAKPSPSDDSGPAGPSLTAVAAGRIQPGTSYQGVATAYKAEDGNGACLFGPSPDLMVAAMNTTDYETSRACGAHVLVRAANGRSVTVRITNECPLPCAPGQIDLSEQAFAELADLKVGRLPITWSLLSPSTSQTMSLRYKTGSSAHWCAVQAIGHRNPVARLEVRTAGGWRALPRTEYNYFLSADGSGCGGTIRVTDIHGEQLTVSGIAVRPDVVQPTGMQFARR